MYESRAQRRRILVCAGVALVCALLSAAFIGVATYAACKLSLVATRAATIAGGFTLLACACMIGAMCLQDRRRRRQVEQLAERLDVILHNTSSVQTFDDYNEGELSVLANELQKMCVLLRDQAQALRHERDSLADSLADISHQLRTPLMTMNLAVELLSRPGTAPERQRELVRELRDLATTMGWLVNSLLTLARADAGTLHLTSVPVNLANLVQKATEPLQIMSELNGQALEVECPSQELVFEGDAGWSREALANIVKNCIEHTPAGGTVRVEASQDVVATRIVVTDTGPGIAPGDLPHVFERFYKGKGSAKTSVGIGLALARCLVTSQGGTLTAGNGVGGGARFVMTFPRVVV